MNKWDNILKIDKNSNSSKGELLILDSNKNNTIIDNVKNDTFDIIDDKYNFCTWIEWLKLRFHDTQLIDDIDDILDYFNSSSYEDWINFYKTQKIKPTILKFLYLRRLKKEDYNKKSFSSLLLDLKYFNKYEFLYPLLYKYLDFWFDDEAINILTHIHKMWWKWKEPSWLLEKYKDFFDLIWNINLASTDEFNWFLKLLFSSWEYDLAKSIYRKIPTKNIKDNKIEILYKNEHTEEIYIKNLSESDLISDFGTYWYVWSDRSFYPSTYLKISEKFLQFWRLDYVIKSINRFKHEWLDLEDNFITKNSDFIEKYYSLNLDFSDTNKLIEWLNNWLSNDNSYYNTLDVIKSMRVIIIPVQHWILKNIKDEDLLLIFDRTLWAKAIKWWWIELWEYALDCLKRFIKIWDKSRCTSSRNSAIALWVEVPDNVIEDYNEMVRIWDIRNTRHLRDYYRLEKLFKDWKYNEAKEEYNNSELWRTLWSWYYTIYIENINNEDFVIEKIRWLNLHLKWEKFLNICLKRAFNLDISTIDQSLFFNTYTFIEDLLKKINNKEYRLTEENLELYKDYIYKKNNNLLPVLKRDKSRASYTRKLMLEQNISFSDEEVEFIDNVWVHNWWEEYWTIFNHDYELHLQTKSIILKYLLLNNYDLWVEYFSWTAKSNELIFIFASIAKTGELLSKFESILIFLLKEKNELKLDVNDTYNDNQFWNVRKQDVYRVIKNNLSGKHDRYLELLKTWLEKIWFKDLDKEFKSTILYKINWYNFKQRHIDDIIDISNLDCNTNFNRNYLYNNYNYLTYLSNVHIRWEKKWVNWELYSKALLEMSAILFEKLLINDRQFDQLKRFFLILKSDCSKWKGIRKQWLTLFEVVTEEYNSNIDNIISKWIYNTIELGWKIINLSERGTFLHYLFKTNYNKAISFFWWNSKTNYSIALFINFAKDSDIKKYSQNIINFFSKQKIDNQDSPYSKGSYKWYTNIRSDFVFNIMNAKLSNNYDWFLRKIKLELIKKWFKDFDGINDKNLRYKWLESSISKDINKILNKFNSWNFWDIDSLLD